MKRIVIGIVALVVLIGGIGLVVALTTESATPVRVELVSNPGTWPDVGNGGMTQLEAFQAALKASDIPLDQSSYAHFHACDKFQSDFQYNTETLESIALMAMDEWEGLTEESSYTFISIAHHYYCPDVPIS